MAPILVMRLSPLVACILSEYLLTCIVRNFKQKKLLFSLPDRSCLKKTGPRESNFIKIKRIGNNQVKINTITRKEKTRSKVFLNSKLAKNKQLVAFWNPTAFSLVYGETIDSLSSKYIIIQYMIKQTLEIKNQNT